MDDESHRFKTHSIITMDDVMVAVYKDGHWIAMTAEHLHGRTYKPHL